MSISPTGIIQLFLHPPIGTMTTEQLPNEPYTGLVTVTRVRGPVSVDAFGIRYTVLTIPPGYGVTPGPGTNVVDRTVVSASVTHSLLNGRLIESQGQSFRTTSGQLIFQESFPSFVTLEMSPGIGVRLEWLLVL